MVVPTRLANSTRERELAGVGAVLAVLGMAVSLFYAGLHGRQLEVWAEIVCKSGAGRHHPCPTACLSSSGIGGNPLLAEGAYRGEEGFQQWRGIVGPVDAVQVGSGIRWWIDDGAIDHAWQRQFGGGLGHHADAEV